MRATRPTSLADLNTFLAAALPSEGVSVVCLGRIRDKDQLVLFFDIGGLPTSGPIYVQSVSSLTYMEWKERAWEAVGS